MQPIWIFYAWVALMTVVLILLRRHIGALIRGKGSGRPISPRLTDPAIRAYVRTLPCLLLAWPFILAVTAEAAVGPRLLKDDMLGPILLITASPIIAIALASQLVIFFNRPKFLVPSWMRSDRGLAQAWFSGDRTK